MKNYTIPELAILANSNARDLLNEFETLYRTRGEVYVFSSRSFQFTRVFMAWVVAKYDYEVEHNVTDEPQFKIPQLSDCAYKIEIRWYDITIGCITPYRVKFRDVLMDHADALKWQRTMQPMLRPDYKAEITQIRI